MEFIFDFVKNIVAITVILNMVECLVASSEYGKYIRLFTGILTIVGVLSMIGGKNKYGEVFDKSQKVINRYGNVMSTYKEYEKNANKGLEKLHKNITKDYEKSIEEELSENGVELLDFRIKGDKKLGDVEKIFIKVKGISEGEKEYKEKVYKIISQYYAIEYNALKVEILG